MLALMNGNKLATYNRLTKKIASFNDEMAIQERDTPQGKRAFTRKLHARNRLMRDLKKFMNELMLGS